MTAAGENLGAKMPVELELLPGRGTPPARVVLHPADDGVHAEVDVGESRRVLASGLLVVASPYPLLPGWFPVVLPPVRARRAQVPVTSGAVRVDPRRWSSPAAAGRVAAHLAELADWREVVRGVYRSRHRQVPDQSLRDDVDLLAGQFSDQQLPGVAPVWPEPTRTGESYEQGYDPRQGH